jgi:nitrate/nitrite transport system ATP-binding protein
MSFLELRGVGKSYGKGPARSEILTDINLKVEEGEFIAIVGFSGTGKTTLISTLAGLIAPDAGSIALNGKSVIGAGHERGVVFQNYSLMPWLTVHGNVALAVDAVFPALDEKEREARTRKYIDMVGLSHAIERRPAALSGGMRQRVAVARALAMEPQILLLDEPLSALDALTRANLQDEIEAIWRQQGVTIVLVTNDVDEALLLADRIIPLRPPTESSGATFGREFKVNLPRPRDRKDINRNDDYRHLRAEVTRYLTALGKSAAVSHDQGLPPQVVPLIPVERAPKAMRREPDKPAANLDKYAEFYDVTKIYPTSNGPLTVVDRFNLNIRKGEFISLIGHSGCGKSTLLSMMAGLNEISDGGIVLDGREITDAGPDRGVVFQAPNLLPWLTTRENVALGVDRVYGHASAAEREEIVDYYLTRVGLGDALDKRASELSNGMKQRVGLARAFALSPKLLLLDEPFGMLDALTRWELQEVLMEIWKRTQVTAICVTHDVDEAILLADRVVMMTNGPHARIGKIMEIDLPRPRSRKALFEHPRYYGYRQELLAFLAEHDTHARTHAA